jgi:hypothetical protein
VVEAVEDADEGWALFREEPPMAMDIPATRTP